MPLDKQKLQSAIQAAFDDAKKEEWETAQVAAALAAAIDAYVRGAEVQGVKTAVEVQSADGGQVLQGTGTQTGSGRVQ